MFYLLLAHAEHSSDSQIINQIHSIKASSASHSAPARGRQEVSRGLGEDTDGQLIHREIPDHPVSHLAIKLQRAFSQEAVTL